MLVVAVVLVMLKISLPVINTSLSNMYLGSAASSLAGAIQSARFQAISAGCPVQIAVSSTTYQISAESITGSPPACNTTFANVGSSIQFASSQISQSPSTTLQLNPSGTVTAVGGTIPTTFSLVLSQLKSTQTKTVNVSGMGYVKVTSP
jgi:Tfp pilus assembly protein FimT